MRWRKARVTSTDETCCAASIRVSSAAAAKQSSRSGIGDEHRRHLGRDHLVELAHEPERAAAWGVLRADQLAPRRSNWLTVARDDLAAQDRQAGRTAQPPALPGRLRLE